jgi:hypothetical protein
VPVDGRSRRNPSVIRTLECAGPIGQTGNTGPESLAKSTQLVDHGQLGRANRGDSYVEATLVALHVGYAQLALHGGAGLPDRDYNRSVQFGQP